MSASHLVPLAVLREAAALVDDSGVVEKLTDWQKADQKHRGGRATTLGTRAVLVAWVTVALEKGPLHMKRVAEVLSVRLHPEAADILGVPREFAEVAAGDMLQRVSRATDRFMKVVDYKPLPNRHRKLLKSEWEAQRLDRDQNHDVYEERRGRLFRVINDLLHTQYLSLPESVRTPRVSLTVDATFMSAFGRGASKERLAARASDEKYISEPDAGWYIRSYENKDGNAPMKKLGFGWEYELVALISNDPGIPRAVPHIAIGFNQHPASFDSNPRAREIFDDILARGLKIDHAVGDQAYFPGAHADELQNPLRRQGAKLVMKYEKTDKREANGEGTIQGTAHGAIQVEGQWYCPALPAELRRAMVDYQNAIKTDRANPKLSRVERETRATEHLARRNARIAERRRWEMRRKEKPDDRGRYPMVCPAVGPNRTLSCPLKPEQKAPLPKGAVPLPVLHPPKAPPTVCTNKSSTSFHIDDDGKYGQHYRYGSPEWQQAHSYGRQVIESFNKSLKHSDNVLHDNGTRRKKGEAAQAFLVALGVIATNSSRIHLWMNEHYDEKAKAPDALSRNTRTDRPVAPARGNRRKTKGISAARAAQLGLPSPDPRVLRTA
jgi:hypothetical protein